MTRITIKFHFGRSLINLNEFSSKQRANAKLNKSKKIYKETESVLKLNGN